MTELVAITPERHAKKVWKQATDYAFAAGQAVIPLVGAELSKTSGVMPIGFIKVDSGYQLVAITSLQPETINVAKKNPMRESFSNGCLNVLMSLVPYFFDSLGRDKARWVFIFCLMVEAGYKAVYGV